MDGDGTLCLKANSFAAVVEIGAGVFARDHAVVAIAVTRPERRKAGDDEDALPRIDNRKRSAGKVKGDAVYEARFIDLHRSGARIHHANEFEVVAVRPYRFRGGGV